MNDLTKKYTDILMSKPDLTDDEVHKLAEENNVDIHKLEQYAYKLSYMFLKEFLYSGFSKGKLFKMDPKELEMGIKVEMEHTSNKLISKKISMDHLTENPKYYTYLKEMEDKATAAGDQKRE